MSISKYTRRVLAITLIASLTAAALLISLAGKWDQEAKEAFSSGLWQLPSSIYARSLEVFSGSPVGQSQIIDELQRLGYKQDSNPSRAGQYAIKDSTIEVFTREFTHWEGVEPSQKAVIIFKDGSIEDIKNPSGENIDIIRLEPPLIGHIYPSRKELRQLVKIGEVPELLVKGLVAVEDRNFYSHHGVDPKGIARAMWLNLKAGKITQGASTLTQQLVKNLFLSPEQSYVRKFREIVMAFLIERRFSKQEILESYLNEVFFGQTSAGAIHGFGLASIHYFGTELNKITTPQMALLIAIVNGPSYYDPIRHPDRAKGRRNMVLQLMEAQGVITSAEMQSAMAAPLDAQVERRQANLTHPAFLELVQQQLMENYSASDLKSAGLRIFSTLDPRSQELAENSVRRFLKDYKEIEGAFVALSPQTGDVLALVGGKDSQFAGFNRALAAKRPIGSLIKPFITLAALQEGKNLATLLSDDPINIPLSSGKTWNPTNYDGESHGQVPLILALAKSYNQAFVRLGMEIGVAKVAKIVSSFSNSEIPSDNPSLLLGAIELSPLQVAQAFQVIAGGGFSIQPKSVLAVLDSNGTPLKRFEQDMKQLLDKDKALLTQYAMSAVMHMGTGATAALPSGFETSGKTGTTNDYRDSWFAGFSQDLLAVAWIGRDDNAKTHLTGATGALKVWTNFMKDSNSKGLVFHNFPKMEVKSISMTTGKPTDPACPDAIQIPLNTEINLDTSPECVSPITDPLITNFHEYQRTHPMIGKQP
ncbi:MAG: penicillin-binding protein 1B [Pseudomonadota bacterium]